MNIYEISTQIRNIYEELQDGTGVDEETGEVKPEIIEALMISKNDLQSKAIDYGYVVKSFGDEIDIYDREIKRLTARKKQLQNIQDRVSNILRDAMVEFNMPKIEGKTIKVSLRKSDSVEILDLNALDEKFKRTKITIEPDKVAIKKSIKNGEIVNGAVIVEKQNIQIK